MPEDHKEIIHKAYDYAVHHHDGQQRKSGEPYVIHPIGTATKLYALYNDPILCASGLLHDTVEDCEEVERKDIYTLFGDTIGFIVDGVTKQMKDFYAIDNVHISDRVERLLWAGMKDVRVLLLKLADRENNLETLHRLKHHKQIRMAFETQAVFMPLKRILDYDSCNSSVKKANEAFTEYLKVEHITLASELKERLFTESFEALDSEMFGLVYSDTSSIVWKIRDIETYRRICNTKGLEKKLHFESVSGNKDWFDARFTFKAGALIPTDINLSVSSFES